MAGVTHDDIDLCMIYDSFTITVLATLENLGFCKPGEGGAFVGGRPHRPRRRAAGQPRRRRPLVEPPGHARHLPRDRGGASSCAASAARARSTDARHRARARHRRHARRRAQRCDPDPGERTDERRDDRVHAPSAVRVDWESRGYWEGAGRGELVLQRCRAAALVQHEPRALCVTLPRRRRSSTSSRRAAARSTPSRSPTRTRSRRSATRLPYVARLRRARGGAAGADQHRRLRARRRCAIGMRVVADFVPVEADPRGGTPIDAQLAVPRFRPGMILDLHTHSIALRRRARQGRELLPVDPKRKELPLDGFVLTEHRQFDDESGLPRPRGPATAC